MTDELPTIWDADPHTIEKHKILKTYLQAWVPIMSRQSQNRVLVVDGFAGPGVYSRGRLGSPFVAIDSILEHTLDFPVPIDFLFIEANQERHARLEAEVERRREKITQSSKRIGKVTVKRGKCEEVLNEGLDRYEEKKEQLGPAFFFLDQFGYSDVSMRLIGRIMSHPRCEVFSYLNWNRMNQFLSDKHKWGSITNAFGGEEWKSALEVGPAERNAHLLRTYKNALKEKANASYVWHFAMIDRNNRLLYWLFFSTNSLRGLEEMKKAMRRVDDTGCFQFSDRENPDQLQLLQVYTDEWLCEELCSQLKGRVMMVVEVKEFVLTQTPCVNYKAALKIAENTGRLEVVDPPPRRRKGTFKDEGMKVRFLS